MLKYGKVVLDAAGCAHSIDNLVVEYFIDSFSADAVIDSLATEVFAPSLPSWDREKSVKLNMAPSSRYSWFRSHIWGGGFTLSYGHYTNFDPVERTFDELPLLRVKFNPNKHSNDPLLSRLLAWLDAHAGSDGSLVKFDYAVDVPVAPCFVEVHSRKEPGLLKGTRYYGQRGRHGRLKVYDKQKEAETECPLTRLEWTFAAEKPLVFDDAYYFTCGPEPLPDASALDIRTFALVRLVSDIRTLGGDVRQALSYLNFRTRKKIEPYTLGSGVRLISPDMLIVRAILSHYCDALSVSYRCTGVNGFDIGVVFRRLSADDLEAETDLPF